MTDGWFVRDTTSAHRRDGIRDLVIHDRWVTPLGRVNGGFVLAALLRALAADKFGADDPLVASITYCPPRLSARSRSTAARSSWGGACDPGRPT